MFSSPEEARNDMFALFTREFTNHPVACAIRYQGKIQPEPTGYYARVSAVEVMSQQSAFAVTDEPDPSPAVYTTRGFLYVAIAAPIAVRDAFHYGGLLATKARDIFRGTGTKSGVTFRNARREEIPLRQDDKEYRWNVVVEFEYDERKER